MTDLYKFETSQFGISEKSIHLLRNKFCFKQIDFSNIDSILIKKGMEVKNWPVVLILGIAMIAFAFYDTVNLYMFFTSGKYHRIEVHRIVVPFLPFVLGLYLLIISVRKSFIMHIKIDRKKYYFSLRDIIKAKKYTEFLESIKRFYPFVEIK